MLFDPTHVIRGIDPDSQHDFVFTDEDWQPPTSVAERMSMGRNLRQRLSRREMGQFQVQQRDPLAILDQQNADRLAHLLPLRAARMSESPFAFYRGTAGIMAADLAAQQHSGVNIPSCGDARSRSQPITLGASN